MSLGHHCFALYSMTKHKYLLRKSYEGLLALLHNGIASHSKKEETVLHLQKKDNRKMLVKLSHQSKKKKIGVLKRMCSNCKDDLSTKIIHLVLLSYYMKSP